jgi:hypothetical protein
MTTLISGSHRIAVKPKTITLRTHAGMLEWKQKLTARAAQTSQSKNVELVLKLMKEIPDLASLITPSGDFNMATVETIAGNYKNMTPEESQEAAKQEIQRRILGIAADSPDVARTLFFPDVAISCDPESIALCIDCIRATYDPNGMSAADVALMMTEPTSDFWQDMSWKEVAEYGEKFCELFK